jgi:predicted DNA-binding transcriptional regulator AlpA
VHPNTISHQKINNYFFAIENRNDEAALANEVRAYTLTVVNAHEIVNFKSNIEENLIVNLLSISDLCDRWNYTKAGIHKLIKEDEFPKPFAVVSRGKIRIFHEEDIRIYEQNKPWLFNQEIKKQRQNLFLILAHSTLQK